MIKHPGTNQKSYTIIPQFFFLVQGCSIITLLPDGLLLNLQHHVIIIFNFMEVTALIYMCATLESMNVTLNLKPDH